MGVLDTVIFHQFLQWHNFYVHTTTYWRIVSDGALHLALAALMVFAAVSLFVRRREFSGVVQARRTFGAGFLLGMGGFQLFDGIVDHKVLQLHPIREGVANQLPYDLAWNAAAIALLVAGWLLWRGVKAGSSHERVHRRSSAAT